MKMRFNLCLWFWKKSRIFLLLFMFLSMVVLEPYFVRSVFAESSSGMTREQCISQGGFKFDIRNSLIFSILTLCLPGIINKIHKYKQIKCEYVKCYYEALKNNLPPTYCKNLYQYKLCSEVVKEFLIDQLFDAVKSLVNSFLKNPLLFVGAVGMYALRCSAEASCCGVSPTGVCSFLSFGMTSGACPGVIITLSSVDILTAAGQLKAILDNKDLLSFDTKDACDGIDDIEKEVKEVLEGMV